MSPHASARAISAADFRSTLRTGRTPEALREGRFFVSVLFLCPPPPDRRFRYRSRRAPEGEFRCDRDGLLALLLEDFARGLNVGERVALIAPDRFGFLLHSLDADPARRVEARVSEAGWRLRRVSGDDGEPLALEYLVRVVPARDGAALLDASRPPARPRPAETGETPARGATPGRPRLPASSNRPSADPSGLRQPGPASPHPPGAPALKPATKAPRDHAWPRVLLVQDRDSYARLLGVLLRRRRFGFSTCDGWERALTEIRRDPPAIVLLRMPPGPRGWQRRLTDLHRASPPGREARVYVLGAEPPPEEVAPLIEGWFPDPLVPGDLVRQITEPIER